MVVFLGKQTKECNKHMLGSRTEKARFFISEQDLVDDDSAATNKAKGSRQFCFQAHW